jgi:hypothetical protein
VSGKISTARSPNARQSFQASSRKASIAGSWTAVIGLAPWSLGSMSSKPPSDSSAPRIVSARSGVSKIPIALPSAISCFGECRRCSDE